VAFGLPAAAAIPFVQLQPVGLYPVVFSLLIFRLCWFSALAQPRLTSQVPPAGGPAGMALVNCRAGLRRTGRGHFIGPALNLDGLDLHASWFGRTRDGAIDCVWITRSQRRWFGLGFAGARPLLPCASHRSRPGTADAPAVRRLSRLLDATLTARPWP